MAKSFVKIDVFSHVLPEKYRKALYSKAQRSVYREDLEPHHNTMPALFDMGLRFSIMDKYEGLRQVLSIMMPPLEAVARPSDAVMLARLANDEMTDLVAKYPDRFAGGVALLPMNDVDAALKETERAIKVLGMKGVEIYTPCAGKPLDSPEFLPIYEMMVKYDLPVWIHPMRGWDVPDYRGESFSKYRINQRIGWPYETSAAMIRLVMSGVLEKYPSLKIITHHCGGMIPYFVERICGESHILLDEVGGIHTTLTRPLVEYFRMFYGDTCTDNAPAQMCGYAFFGAEHILFATDNPTDKIGKTIASVEQMAITDSEKYQIFEGNARRLLCI